MFFNCFSLHFIKSKNLLYFKQTIYQDGWKVGNMPLLD